MDVMNVNYTIQTNTKIIRGTVFKSYDYNWILYYDLEKLNMTLNTADMSIA